jgi:hypothetical protein
MAVQELPLLDRRFTWSDHQEDPILVRLDRFFVNIDWSLCLPNSTIASHSAAISDHCQLMLTAATTIPKPAVFRFNNHWTRVAGFKEVVTSARLSVHEQHDPHNNLAAALVKKLKRCRHDLKLWHQGLKSPIDILKICNLVIDMLDRLEKARPLFLAEFNLRKLVRAAAQEKGTQLAIYWRQRGKFRACRLGDENTKFHHMYATVQSRRNQIRTLQAADGTMVTDHVPNAAILHAFYSELRGQADHA